MNLETGDYPARDATITYGSESPAHSLQNIVRPATALFLLVVKPGSNVVSPQSPSQSPLVRSRLLFKVSDRFLDRSRGYYLFLLLVINLGFCRFRETLFCDLASNNESAATASTLLSTCSTPVPGQATAARVNHPSALFPDLCPHRPVGSTCAPKNDPGGANDESSRKTPTLKTFCNKPKIYF